MKFASRIVVLTGICILFAKPAVADADVRSWHSIAVKPVVTDRVEVVAVGNVRFADWSTTLNYAFGGVRAQVKIWEPYRVGVGYVHERLRRKDTSGFETINRAQVFVSRVVPVRQRWIAATRQQLELRYFELRDNPDVRSRHLIQLSYAVPELPYLSAISANNEVFFNYNRMTVSENRLTPVILTFKPWKRIELTTFGMVRTRNLPDRWDTYLIFGWTLSYVGPQPAS